MDFGILQTYRSKVSCYCIWKNGREFAFQIIEDLGTLIEYENTNNFDGKSDLEIKNTKKKC